MMAEMSASKDFSETAWIPGRTGETGNGTAEIRLRSAGPDVLASVVAPGRVFLATSLPDWPGWIAESAGGRIPLVPTNHAFVGFWLDAGHQTVRLHYRPVSFLYGLVAFGLGLLAAAAPALRWLRSSG
jgi:hypothetical protein